MIKKKVIQIIENKENDEKAEEPKEVKPKKPSAPRIRKLYYPKYLVKAEGEDASQFDYAAERPSEHKAELFEATSHLVSESLTACLLCLNELNAKNGFLGSLFTIVVLSCLMSYCLYSLTRSAQKVYGITQVPMMTYPDLAQASLDISTYPALRKYGRKFKNAVIAAIVIRLVAKCCVYQLIVASCIQHLIWSSKRDDSPESMRKYSGSLILPFMLICMLKTIDYTAPFSLVTIVYMVIVFIYTMISGFINISKEFDKYVVFYGATPFFSFCGGCVFIMDTSCAILSIENTMSRPRKIYLVIIIGWGHLRAIGGYGWGPKAKVPIVVNFHIKKLPYTTFCRLGMTFSAYNSFALDFWVLFNLVWVNLKYRYPAEKHWLYERLYRAGFVLVITVVVMLLPDISGIMSLFGALASGFLNFMFPPIIEFLVSTRGKRLGKFKWKMIRLVAIATFGWIFILGGTFCGLRDIFLKVYFVSD